MENASKALIIAGAILLAILLISLGIMIFSQAQDSIQNNGMSQAETAAFNNKFVKYEGVKKGSEVRSLIQEVIASNADDNNISANRLITMKLGSATITGSSGVLTSKSYKVEITTYTKGYVSEINLTAQ